MARSTVAGIPIDWLTDEEVIRKIKVYVTSGKPHQIATVNPEFIVMSQHNSEFRSALEQSDLCLPDGTGVVLTQTLDETVTNPNPLVRAIGFVLLGIYYVISPGSFHHKRITGVQLADDIMRTAAEENWRVFLLGGGKTIAERAGAIWEERYPGVTIVGHSDARWHNPNLTEIIKSAKPDILFVAFGAPKQELFIRRNFENLKVPVMVGLGGTFDTVVGAKFNPPKWLKHIGLEWLSYLVTQPKRFKRIWRSTIGFFWLVVRAAPNR